MPERSPCGAFTDTYDAMAVPISEGFEQRLKESLNLLTLMGMLGLRDCVWKGWEFDLAGELQDGRIVLCGANAYEQKYYFNKDFDKIPESIKKELHVISVLFTQEVGGIFTIVFEKDGSVSLETNAEEDDITYDEISSGLLIGEIRRKRQELFESLELYYRVFIKHEDVSALLAQEDE